MGVPNLHTLSISMPLEKSMMLWKVTHNHGLTWGHNKYGPGYYGKWVLLPYPTDQIWCPVDEKLLPEVYGECQVNIESPRRFLQSECYPWGRKDGYSDRRDYQSIHAIAARCFFDGSQDEHGHEGCPASVSKCDYSPDEEPVVSLEVVQSLEPISDEGEWCSLGGKPVPCSKAPADYPQVGVAWSIDPALVQRRKGFVDERVLLLYFYSDVRTQGYFFRRLRLPCLTRYCSRMA